MRKKNKEQLNGLLYGAHLSNLFLNNFLNEANQENAKTLKDFQQEFIDKYIKPLGNGNVSPQIINQGLFYSVLSFTFILLKDLVDINELNQKNFTSFFNDKKLVWNDKDNKKTPAQYCNRIRNSFAHNNCELKLEEATFIDYSTDKRLMFNVTLTIEQLNQLINIIQDCIIENKEPK